MADTLPKEKPIVVGLYGIPGSGKTYLLRQLQEKLPAEEFKFYEGSELIAGFSLGGLTGFRRSGEKEKAHIRRLAIEYVQRECIDSKKVGVVAGHYMFWDEGQDSGQPVYIQKDLETYTHILYLNTSVAAVWNQRRNDTSRDRPSTSESHLARWQTVEKTQLRHLCYENGILFSVVNLPFLDRVVALLRDFREHTEPSNLFQAKITLDALLSSNKGPLQTVLVMDGDKTLSAQDTGSMFWSFHPPYSPSTVSPLKNLFSSQMGYSHAAFRQASLLYSDLASTEGIYESDCDAVASEVAMYPEFISLLKRVETQEHVGAIVLTCGLGRIWQKVIDNAGLSSTVKVLGNGVLSDKIVVTPAVKASLIAHLRDTHKVYVWAFGDSPLDLPMLEEADRSVIVVGEKGNRSKSMDGVLLEAINKGSLLQARQALLPGDAPPRLDTAKLPVIQLGDSDLVHSIIRRRNHLPNPHPGQIHVIHATDKNAAKLLMTPTRNAKVSGHDLIEAHRRVGWYLATEYLTELVGIEDYPIDHVQGRQTSGYRICDEKSTLIVALMRGGEPMALGVFEVLKQASFLHARYTDDIKSSHMEKQRTVVLVDSVINNGDTAVEFVKHVRSMNKGVRIIVVAGVVQKNAISEGAYAKQLASYTNLSLVALRLSDNKFKGQGTTDTGNRLFNTTQLD